MGLLLGIERTLMTLILTAHACVTGNYADPCIICTSAKGEENHMLSPHVASPFFLLGNISYKKEMAGKMEIAIYFSWKSGPFLFHMKDIKGTYQYSWHLSTSSRVSRAEVWKKIILLRVLQWWISYSKDLENKITYLALCYNSFLDLLSCFVCFSVGWNSLVKMASMCQGELAFSWIEMTLDIVC